MDWSGSGQGQNVGTYKGCAEPSGSEKCGKFLDWLEKCECVRKLVFSDDGRTRCSETSKRFPMAIRRHIPEKQQHPDGLIMTKQVSNAMKLHIRHFPGVSSNIQATAQVWMRCSYVRRVYMMSEHRYKVRWQFQVKHRRRMLTSGNARTHSITTIELMGSFPFL